jgi:hypothetical protein
MKKGWAVLGGVAMVLVGLILIGAGLGMPAHFGFIDRAELEAAASRAPEEGAANLSELAQAYLAAELVGPAQLVVAAMGPSQESEALRALVNERLEAEEELRATGGPAPFFSRLYRMSPLKPESPGEAKVMPLLAPEKNRDFWRNFLTKTKSPAVAAILDSRSMTGTTKFFPAGNPGGAPLDASILVTALLVQGGHFGDMPQVIELADLAQAAGRSEASAVRSMETFYQGLLRLGLHLNWRQMTEFARLSTGLADLPRLAEQARAQPEQVPLLFSASALSGRPGDVAGYLERHGPEAGWRDLAEATRLGRGALEVLLDRARPIHEPPGWMEPAMAARELSPESLPSFALEHHPQALFIKALFFLGAGVLLSFGVAIVLSPGVPREWNFFHPLDFARHGLLALVVLASLIALSEPSLFAEAAERPSRLQIDFGAVAQAGPAAEPTLDTSMPDQITILMLGIFFVLQVVIYLICLIRVSHIRRLDAPTGLKMSLLENEDVLFDSGLYVGLGGTVASLIMLAMGVVEASLIAAYASTLFGIIFVAILKIFHVRPFRRALLYDMQRWS